LAIDSTANCFIADFGNGRIRKVYSAPTLPLAQATPSNIGNYSVIISSPYGSVTSVVVSLTVTIPRTPPQILTGGTAFGVTSNQFGFKVNGAFGQTIVVDGSTDLVNWMPIFTNTSGGNPVFFSDSASTNFPRRFYRARLP
jgi:hypothetical protein